MLKAKGIREVPIIRPNGEKCYIDDVLHVPGLKKILIFVSEIGNNKMSVHFEHGKCAIRDCKRKIVVVRVIEDGFIGSKINV